MEYVSVKDKSFDDKLFLSQIERKELLKFGIPVQFTNKNNFTSVYKFQNKNLAYRVEDFVINDFKAFNEVNMSGIYRGCNFLIPRLVDFDIVIYDQVANIIIPLSQAMYVSTTIRWRPDYENFQIFKTSDERHINPKINQGQYYWFDSGIVDCDRCGEVHFKDIFVDDMSAFGKSYVWDVPLRAKDVTISYCAGQNTNTVPAAINNQNEIVGIYLYGQNFSKYEKYVKAENLPDVIRNRPKPVDYEDY